MSNETSPTSEKVETLMARVFALVRACPVGRVTTYGWLARTIGYPRGARMIGWIMNESPEGVPAQRVINSKGELSGSWAFGQRGMMRQLLEAEGLERNKRKLSPRRTDTRSWTRTRFKDTGCLQRRRIRCQYDFRYGAILAALPTSS